MLILLDVIIESSNVEGEKKELSNVTKVQSYMMLVLPNAMMELSNVNKN